MGNFKMISLSPPNKKNCKTRTACNHVELPCCRGVCFRRVNSRGGFTLVELLVALMIMAIVMTGWWRIMNATSPYREAQRLAAMEIAAGVLDIFPSTTLVNTFYRVNVDGSFSVVTGTSRQLLPTEWFPTDAHPFYYTLGTTKFIATSSDPRNWKVNSWNRNTKILLPAASCLSTWAVIKVYDAADANSDPDPFVTFSHLIK